MTRHEQYQARERAALNFIDAYWAEHSLSPSVEEIRAHLGLSSKFVAHTLIHRMRDRKVVTFLNGKRRTIRTTGRCPCCGREAWAI